jgi:hypothetical protein
LLPRAIVGAAPAALSPRGIVGAAPAALSTRGIVVAVPAALLPRGIAASASAAADGSVMSTGARRTPLPHQLQGVDFLANAETTLGGSILGDWMGLGKTMTAILLMLRRPAPGRADVS